MLHSPDRTIRVSRPHPPSVIRQTRICIIPSRSNRQTLGERQALIGFISFRMSWQDKANIFNVLILYKENLCVGDKLIKKQRITGLDKFYITIELMLVESSPVSFCVVVLFFFNTAWIVKLIRHFLSYCILSSRNLFNFWSAITILFENKMTFMADLVINRKVLFLLTLR
jgi:hypothetical protein